MSNTFKMFDFNGQPFTKDEVKSLNALTKSSPYYEVFCKRRYRELKGYPLYDDVSFLMARLACSYACSPDLEMFKDFTHRASYLTLNEMFIRKYGVYWLDKNLCSAFYASDLPAISAEYFHRVIPLGLLLLPIPLETPDGAFLNWIAFRHNLKGEPLFPLINKNAGTIKIKNDDYDTLSWFSIVSNGCQYSSTRPLLVEDKTVVVPMYNLEVSKSLQERDKNLDYQKESNFTQKVTELLLQVLLFVQSKKLSLDLEIEPPAAFTKTNLAYQCKLPKQPRKLEPLIIGENYKLKYDTSKLTRTNHSPFDPLKLPSYREVHWRRGYYRNQAIGPRDKPEHKLVWIEPVLVNAYTLDMKKPY